VTCHIPDIFNILGSHCSLDFTSILSQAGLLCLPLKSEWKLHDPITLEFSMTIKQAPHGWHQGLLPAGAVDRPPLWPWVKPLRWVGESRKTLPLDGPVSAECPCVFFSEQFLTLDTGDGWGLANCWGAHKASYCLDVKIKALFIFQIVPVFKNYPFLAQILLGLSSQTASFSNLSILLSAPNSQPTGRSQQNPFHSLSAGLH
jgi:hypothetical protein